MMSRILAAAALTFAAACAGGGDSASSTPAPAPNVVTFTANDFTFDGPTEIPAGLTTVRMVSAGKEMHHLTIVKLDEGKTIDSLMAAFKNPGPPPVWATFAGGPNPPPPGMESNATVNLEPGNYAILCLVDTPDKVPHVMKGMSRPLTVTSANAQATAAFPNPTLTITMKEYAFELDKPLTAGKHSIRVVHNGIELHELSIIRLDSGKTLEDLGAWMETMQGPPPGAPLGGIAPIVKGRDSQFDIDIAPGRYVLICFIPAPDGKMHFMHGMQQTIDVQ
jgi:hypothetical protein